VKNKSGEANMSKNENANSGTGEDTDTVKGIEKQIISKNTTTQVLIERESSDDYPLSVRDFRINDSKILSLLNREIGSNYYSFTGLMRKLNIHQQSLARALNRLLGLGLIDRTSMGYKLTKNAVLLLSKSDFDLSKTRERNERIQLLQTYIPVNVKPNEVVTSLIGKWFNNLRWIGMIEGETGYILQWINENDTCTNSFQVDLKIVSDYIVIETNAVSQNEKIEAMVGSYRMLQHIIKLFQNKLGVLCEYMINPNQYLPNKNN
jgi:DNA-binding Lrp family transcriptional regulator